MMQYERGRGGIFQIEASGAAFFPPFPLSLDCGFPEIDDIQTRHAILSTS
jgi:hypothetical protein